MIQINNVNKRELLNAIDLAIEYQKEIRDSAVQEGSLQEHETEIDDLQFLRDRVEYNTTTYSKRNEG